VSLVLFGHPFSSYTWKAMIPLYANGSPFTLRVIGDDPEAAAFVQAAHAAGKFPVLADDDTTIIEATAIIEYLAVHHPGEAPLIPSDPGEAIIVRMLDRVFDNYVMANLQRFVSAYLARGLAPDAAELAGAREGLLRAYHWLESWLGANPLPEHTSLVTCAAAPSLFYADWVQQIPADCPRLADLRAELLAIPAVARCVDDARPYRHLFPPGAPDRD
jgi:glutathione S-transferase